MIYKLLLVLFLSNGQSEVNVIDYNLSRDDCISQMLIMNKVFEAKANNAEFMCEGVQIDNELYTSGQVAESQ